GATAGATVSRFYTLLDGNAAPLAGATADQTNLAAQRNANQISVPHQMQAFKAGTDQEFSTSWDLRRFHKAADAGDWLAAYPDGIQRDFGVPLQAISEGTDIAGSDGSRFFI